ncbi:MAG: hypothetical protein MI749_05175 [Desulfovibrionales bacterium]|nr:hypothetical protein [Desulfovibrionales bacterium]
MACLILFFSFFILHRAQPEFDTLFDEFYEIDLRMAWDDRFLYYLALMMLVGLGVSLSSLLLGLFRARRKSDKKRQIFILVVLYVLLTLITLNFL